MYGSPAGSRPKSPSQGTAELMILLGFVFQLIFSIVYLFFGTLGLVAGTFFLFGGFVGGFILLLAALVTILPILMLYVAYRYSYRRAVDGDFAGARGPTLLLGILGIFLGGIITGIFYIIGYVKLGDAETEARSMGGWAGGGPTAYPYGTPYSANPGPAYQYGRPGAPPAAGGVAYGPPPMARVASVCPRCGRPATYIPQYGRSYCYNCTQYV
jgi:hypothetical protein